LPEVKLVNVTKRYGKIVANDGVTLTIKDGEYVSVIGPSGCGKSTLIKNIAGIITPDEGEIYFDGRRVNELPIEDREIGYVFQNIALFPHLSVWGNVTYGPRVRGLSPEKVRPLAIEMLEMINVSERSDAYPNELSRGTQQKTAVARALTSRAELLLLDEPLGALDVKVRAMMRSELKRLVKDLKLTALHVTHDQEEALSISDRVVVMKMGRIVEEGAPIALYTSPKNLFTANFVGEANFLPGEVVKASGKSGLVELEEGLEIRVESNGQRMGDRVVTAFRPEFVNVETNGVNRLKGRVVDVLYSGSIGRIRVKLGNGSIVVAKQMLHSEVATIRSGNDITLSIPPQRILVYPYPKGGLEKELALE
jgi:ABC-type Fe3+/spermidine/putrescine transport system ATPase subunit